MKPWFSLCLLLLLVPSGHAGVIVVDPGGGDGAALLQAALDVAQDGDVILLKAGDYLGAQLPVLTTSRGVTIVADDGLAPLTVRAIQIDPPAAGGTLVLRGLRVAGPNPDGSLSPHSGGSVDIAGSGPASVAWIEDCDVVGIGEPGPQFSHSGMNVESGEADGSGMAVTAVRSSFSGAQGSDFLHGAGGDAIFGGVYSLPRLNLFECLLQGGEGDDIATPVPDKPDGGNGLFLFGEWLYAADTVFLGGAEGLNSPQATVSGSGLQLLFAMAEGFLRGCEMHAGPVQGPIGTQGPDIVNPANDIVDFLAAPRSLSVPALCREGQATAMTVRGKPGDLVAFILSPAATWSPPIAARQGPAIVDFTQRLGPFVIGAISAADGTLVVPFQVPFLPPGLDAQRLFAQGLFAGDDGLTLGSGSAFVWLGAAF